MRVSNIKISMGEGLGRLDHSYFRCTLLCNQKVPLSFPPTCTVEPRQSHTDNYGTAHNKFVWRLGLDSDN